MSGKSALNLYLQKLPSRTKTIVYVSIYGLAAGLAAVLFHLAIHWLFHLTIVEASHHSPAAFLITSFLTVMSTSLLVGYLLTHYCKEASGSGIPQLKLAFWKDFGFVPWKVVWVKFLAGALSVGGGCSLGREGPSVQLAGALASNVAGKLGVAKQNRRNATAAGAASGLAAAFNTPLAAMTFVLEEIVGDLNSRFLGSVLLASVIGAFVVHGLIGAQPAFSLGQVEGFGFEAYLLIPVVAAVSSCVGVFFQKVTLGLRKRRKHLSMIPEWMRPALGGFITWTIGCTVFLKTGHLGVFGLGYEDLSEGLTSPIEMGWKIAGILLVTKLVATILCYGLGGCGGIFSPNLFLGGMVGVFLANVFNLVIPLNNADQIVLAVVGMSACLGAVVGAPVTSILIVFEMTHEFSLVPALMLGTLISQTISRWLSKQNFYEEILEQDGHEPEHVVPPRDLRSWQQLPVSAIANFQPVVLKSLDHKDIEQVLHDYPYHYFPVVQDKKLMGILSRQKAETAVRTKTEPVLQPAVTCAPTQTIKKLQFLLIESATGVVMITREKSGKVIGVVTLHDLLRAEVAMADDQARED